MRRVALFLSLAALSSLGLLLVYHPPSLVRGQSGNGASATSSESQAATTHKLHCGLWRVDGGFVSTIRIKNSLIVAPLEVTPVLYMADGTPYILPPVQLAVSGVATVNVNQALAQAPPELGGHLSQFGSAALEYTYTSPGHVLGSIEILDVARSLIYTVPFNGAPADNEHMGETWEGLWWRHQPEVSGYVSLANASGGPLQVSLQAIGSRGTALSPHTLELAAYATQLLNLDWLVAGLPGLENQAGGLRVQHNGPHGAVLVTGGLVNESIGYSANMPFWVRDQHAGEPTKITYASVGMMLGDADPAAGFPGGTRFAPYAALRNTTANPLTVKLEVNFMAGLQPVTRSLPDVQLGPFETRYFTFERFFEALGLRGLSGMMNVAASFEGHPGDLVLATGSTDQSGTYVFEVEPQGVGKSFSKEAHYWKVADGFDTMFTLWNPTDQAQDFLVTFFFGEEEGQYKLPVTLVPTASTTIDVSKVIAAQQPDADGKVIPLGTREGSLVFSSAKGMTEWMTLAASIGIVNVQAGTCGTECVSCCGYKVTVTPAETTIAVNGSVTLRATLTDCSGTAKLVAWFWSSGDTSVATVNSVGVVTGRGPGSTGIAARSLEEVVIAFGTVCNQSGTCPTGFPQGGAKVNVIKSEVTTADIVSDRIEVVLSGPTNTSGQLVVTLIGDGGNVQLFSGTRAVGTHTFSFNRTGLPVRQYTRVDAAWTVASATATGNRAVTFRVLGVYRHSQYNTPAESQCSGSPATAYLTTGPTSCPWTTVSLISKFIEQAWLNGSGATNNYGLVQAWLAGCSPPPGGNQNYFRQVSQIEPACGGQAPSDTTVAADFDSAGHPLSCGDSVLIIGLGSSGQTLKTVTDKCPACKGQAQLDNYNTSSACSLTDLGNYTTIRTNR